MALDLKLDASHDLIINQDRDLDMVAGIEEIAQHIHTTLDTPRGQDPIDPTFGPPYLEKILVMNPNTAEINAILRAIIAGRPDIIELTSYAFELDDETRVATITFTATTTEGELDPETLILGA